ncbi:MAG: peptidoglycan-associated lipoprotein Pal [candidate division KSB1 bacterium]|nr:peptidoglycan-associated lipoprotein Pal [candidate division KSB1 bacterium]MDZ7303028.1 peptidoglycan-associated lipoprotein Pal [candidate division KSB1 bacterium]MDZ7312464.1 peptidoglycan-associated lipoprotein Pal [candidate division KSB1 bacterium]
MNRFTFKFAANLIILLLVVIALVGCGGAKKTVQTEMQQPAVPTEQEPMPVATTPTEEVKAYEAERPSTVPLVLNTIYFDFDKFDLKTEALQILAANARALKAHPEASIIIEGHCDERGTIEYNLALGDKRAKAAKNYLVSLGVDPAQISIISYGKERPVDFRHNEEAWAKNRRAEFKAR